MVRNQLPAESRRCSSISCPSYFIVLFKICETSFLIYSRSIARVNNYRLVLISDRCFALKFEFAFILFANWWTRVRKVRGEKESERVRSFASLKSARDISRLYIYERQSNDVVFRLQLVSFTKIFASRVLHRSCLKPRLQTRRSISSEFYRRRFRLLVVLLPLAVSSFLVYTGWQSSRVVFQSGGMSQRKIRVIIIIGSFAAVVPRVWKLWMENITSSLFFFLSFVPITLKIVRL